MENETDFQEGRRDFIEYNTFVNLYSIQSTAQFCSTDRLFVCKQTARFCHKNVVLGQNLPNLNIIIIALQNNA